MPLSTSGGSFFRATMPILIVKATKSKIQTVWIPILGLCKSMCVTGACGDQEGRVV